MFCLESISSVGFYVLLNIILMKSVSITFLNTVIKSWWEELKGGRIYPGSITGIVHYGGEDVVAKVAWAAAAGVCSRPHSCSCEQEVQSC